MKLKLKKVIKFDCGEKFTFIRGKAIIPGMRLFGCPVIITLKEFNELRG